MNLIAIVQGMKTLDILRSSALLVAFGSIFYGNRNRRDSASNWLLVDSVSTGIFGLAFYLFPDVFLGHKVDGKLDPIHLLLMRCYGAMLVSSSCMSAQSRSGNKTQRIITQTVVFLVLNITMYMSFLRSQKDGKQKLNNQHVTFAMLGSGLLLLGSVIEMLRCRGPAVGDSSPLVLKRCGNMHAFIDMMGLLLAFVIYYGFPMFALGQVTAKPFHVDMIHLHLYRLVGVLVFGMVFSYVLAFVSGSKKELHAQVTAHVGAVILSLPVVMWYQWWYQIYTFTPYSAVISIVYFGNLGAAYYEGRKQ